MQERRTTRRESRGRHRSIVQTCLHAWSLAKVCPVWVKPGVHCLAALEPGVLAPREGLGLPANVAHEHLLEARAARHRGAVRRGNWGFTGGELQARGKGSDDNSRQGLASASASCLRLCLCPCLCLCCLPLPPLSASASAVCLCLCRLPLPLLSASASAVCLCLGLCSCLCCLPLPPAPSPGFRDRFSEIIFFGRGPGPGTVFFERVAKVVATRISGRDQNFRAEIVFSVREQFFWYFYQKKWARTEKVGATRKI